MSQGTSRTFRLVLEEKMKKPVLASSPWGALCIRHGMWVHSRSHVRPDGRTPYQIVHGHPYVTEVLEFGTLVLAKTRKSGEAGKMTDRWMNGVWVGKSATTDCHLVVTEHGVVLSRSVKQPTDVSDSVYDEVRFSVYCDEEEQVRAEVPTAAIPNTGVVPEGESGYSAKPTAGHSTALSKKLQEFWTARGKTTGCPACTHGAGGREHSSKCRASQDQRGETDERGNKKKRSEDPEAETEVPGGVSEPLGGASSGNDAEMEFGDESMGTSSASTGERAREESAQSAGQRAAVKKKPAPSGSPGKRPTGERPMAEEPGPVRPRKLEELVHDSETVAIDYVDQEHTEAVRSQQRPVRKDASGSHRR